jgi:hypothetical protein
MDYEQFAQIVLNVTIVCTFIGVFFFTYAAKIEKDIVKDQSEYIASSMATDIRVFLPPSVKEDITKNLTVPDMTDEDDSVKKSNTKLMKKAMLVLGILFIVGITFTFILTKIGKLDMKILINAIIILLFVAITEFVFLNVITRNYNVADPNFVKYSLLKSVKKTFPPIKKSYD